MYVYVYGAEKLDWFMYYVLEIIEFLKRKFVTNYKIRKSLILIWDWSLKKIDSKKKIQFEKKINLNYNYEQVAS